MLFTKKVLTKKYMRDKYSNYDRELVYANKTNFTKFLNEIEQEFYNHDFFRDDRYLCVGRHKIIINEMEELYYTKEQCDKYHYSICPTKWCLDSLLELIFNKNRLFLTDELSNYSELYPNKSLEERKKIYESYNNKEIISLNERDYIMHGINMIKDSLEKCNDNLEWEKDIKYLDIKKFKNLKFNDSLIGFVIGDAVGVPAEFRSRKDLIDNPIKDMTEYGTYNQPLGTWSDDTSMTLATIDSMIKNGNVNYNDIMKNFVAWKNNSEFTANGKCFDIGNTCSNAISKFNGNNAIECGLNDYNSNGNGSLMRMLPIAFYCYYKNKNDDEIFDIVKNISSLTHAHEISILGCYIYVKYIISILNGNEKFKSYEELKKINYHYFSNDSLNVYKRIIKDDIYKYSIEEIKSSGYVVDTLEAVLWVVLNTDNFENSILTAVNLGEDTDTIAAITGSITGLIYGIDDIPQKWINNLKENQYIIQLANNFELVIKDNKFFIDVSLINDLILAINENRACTNAEIVEHDNNLEIHSSIISKELEDFYQYLYSNSFVDYNCRKNYQKINNKNIDEMDINELLTILTYAHRSEKYSDGSMYEFIENGKIIKCLNRLLELSNKN